ncbi:glycosyltransferase [Formosa maritima]|uniref:Glycosyltransferase n=1 Tax=Formosa maritima TaxID=2592046 RepID=A0A5D0GJG5_9FLAO|nr:glycosyltransferase [Formosa maritima]TYA58940.1 glycosyltransferase [Formosa maritima]
MNKKKINILFVLPSLAAGGAERIMSFVAQNLDKEKFDVKLIVTGFEKDTVYQTSDLTIIYLNKNRVLKSVFILFRLLKRERADIVISSIVHLNTFLAFFSKFFPKTKFISREANVLSELSKHNPYNNVIFSKKMIVLAYKLVDKIICQSNDMRQDLVTHFKVPLIKTELINNPITNTSNLKKKARNQSSTIKLITITRLSKHKGHLRILDALSRVDFPFRYTIIGHGTEKETIYNYAKEKGLLDHIEFINFTQEVDAYLSENDLYLQGSYVEGFPNILLESCLVGTPILAFNAPGGLDEIIINGSNGYIADTIDEFVHYLNLLNADFNFNPEIVNSVVTSRFNKEKIISQYEQLFINITHE